MPTDKELLNNLLKIVEQSALDENTINTNKTLFCMHTTTALKYTDANKAQAAGCVDIHCSECIYYAENISRLPQLIENIKQLDTLLNN